MLTVLQLQVYEIQAMQVVYTLMQEVQLFIEIQDRDFGSNNREGANEPDDLVDIFLINYNQTVGMPQRHTYSGIHGFVTMDLNITVFCSAGYNGSECEMNIDDCLSDPCASTGQCVDGVDSFTCSCDQGYTGQLCETDIDECEGVNCSGNGECLDGIGSFSCVCSPGYTGQLCDVDIQGTN